MVLLSKPGCGLCSEAESSVRKIFGSGNVNIVNITGNVALEDEFVLRIPVLMCRGVVVAEGHLDERVARQGLRYARALERARFNVQ